MELIEIGKAVKLHGFIGQMKLNAKFDKDFNLKKIDKMYDEGHYYINMIIAWLLCESFIKNRDITLTYLKNNNLNDFVINKMISKCRDSYRVSKGDKEMLLQFKRKICQK
jgi:hypothetical protein